MVEPKNLILREVLDMALINCSECSKEISDKAAACPGCGAPVSNAVSPQPQKPTYVEYNRESETFTGTMPLMLKLAMRAVQESGWKIDQANEALGLLTFQTGMSWGSWSGVSCSLNIEEISDNTFRVTGTGKQNVSGGQLVALNIGGEAKGKARKAIEKMQELVEPSPDTHVKCPECRKLVRMEASICRHCSCKLIPQS